MVFSTSYRRSYKTGQPRAKRAKEKLERSRLNKEKLLEIAKKNAAKILKSGGDYLGMDTVIMI